MLIQTIAFRIFDNSTGTDKEYLITDSIDHQEMVFANKHTHAIQFGEMFDFQLFQEQNSPKFIQFGDAFLDAMDKNEGIEELDDIDQMV